MCKFNVKHRECLRNHPSQRLMIKCLTSRSNWNLEMLVFEERGKTEKDLSKQSREPTTTQPTYDAGSGNRTRDTLVRGERSHHCANPEKEKKILLSLSYMDEKTWFAESESKTQFTINVWNNLAFIGSLQCLLWQTSNSRIHSKPQLPKLKWLLFSKGKKKITKNIHLGEQFDFQKTNSPRPGNRAKIFDNRIQWRHKRTS